MSNVYYSPEELQAACEKIKKYTEFLVRRMNEYDSLMNSLTNDAVISEKVGASVAELRAAIKPLAMQANVIADSFVFAIVGNTVGEVNDAGNTFRYPEESWYESIKALLTPFL